MPVGMYRRIVTCAEMEDVTVAEMIRIFIECGFEDWDVPK